MGLCVCVCSFSVATHAEIWRKYNLGYWSLTLTSTILSKILQLQAKQPLGECADLKMNYAISSHPTWVKIKVTTTTATDSADSESDLLQQQQQKKVGSWQRFYSHWLSRMAFMRRAAPLLKVVVIADRKISNVRKWAGCSFCCNNNALQLLDFFSSTARGVYLLLFTLALRNLNVVRTLSDWGSTVTVQNWIFFPLLNLKC